MAPEDHEQEVEVNEINQIGKIIIPELNIEVETEMHDKGKPLEQIKIPEGWRLLRINEIVFLHNNPEYRKRLNIEETWEFIEQPFEYNKVRGYTTRFYVGSGRVDLYCDGSSQGSIPTLGVRFCRDLKNEL